VRAPAPRRLAAAGFENVEVTFTHSVADGMHGAIIRAAKTTEPRTDGPALPGLELGRTDRRV
jgi:hypothetical protein